MTDTKDWLLYLNIILSMQVEPDGQETGNRGN